MKNKRVKQMICESLDKRHGLKYPFGHWFDGAILKVCFINGYAPDGFYEDCEVVRQGTISITGKV